MTAFPAAGYVAHADRTTAETQQAIEDWLAATRQLPGARSETVLTIAGGAVTAAGAVHTIDTEGAAAADELGNIATDALPDGAWLAIRCADPARAVTVKHQAGGTGQITLAAGQDIVLNGNRIWLLLKRTGADWEELFRSDVLPLAGGALTGPLSLKKGGDMAAAATVDLAAATGNVFDITGNGGPITGFGMPPGAGPWWVRFAGAPQIAHGAAVLCPGGAAITAAAGDRAVLVHLGGGLVLVSQYARADGTPLVNPTIAVPVRQTVLAASGDSNVGTPWLAAGTGLAVNLSASATPVRIAFAAGFGAAGAVDVLGSITADQANAWTGLPANQTSYLYVDRNPGTGALSFGATATAPLYQMGGPPSVTASQHTYRIDQGVMYVGTGAAVTPVQRVFVGEAVAGAASVNAVVAYALQGKYVAAWATPLPGLSVVSTRTHNIGTTECTATLEARNETDELGYHKGDILTGICTYQASSLIPLNLSIVRRPNYCSFTTGSGCAFMVPSATNGNYSNLAAPNWSWRVTLSRAF